MAPAVVEDFQRNEDLILSSDEALTRTILDLILVDRLNQLQDMNVFPRLPLSAEVPMSMTYVDERGKDVHLKGRADWALGYGTDRRNTESMLIIVQAKAAANSSVGIPQASASLHGSHESCKKRPDK